MVSYLGSLVQFRPGAGRAGAADRHHCVWGALAVFRPHWVCPAHGCLCFPVYTTQAPGCSIWSGPCVECGSSFSGPPQERGLVAPAFCAFPGLSGLGSQRLDGYTLPGCGAPSRLRSSSLSFCARLWGARGLCLFSGVGL